MRKTADFCTKMTVISANLGKLLRFGEEQKNAYLNKCAIKNSERSKTFRVGATGQNRTDNLLITNELLCH